jgi:hypothetical protein
MSTTKTVSGTLVRFDFSAPHARVVLTHVNEKGEAEEFQIMTGSPTQLLRRGFDPRQFHKGDKVEVTYHPNRNGALGGQLEKMVMADGRELVDPSADERRALQSSAPANAPSQAAQADQKKDN